jgi:uncharacterized integral membrane protein (TIGR00698 family)
MTAASLGSIPSARGQVLRLAPGVIAAAVTAAAASFLADHYAAPVMLFALLLGMAMNFLAADTRCAPGIEFAARTVLRAAVALLGLRITAGQVAALGWAPVLGVVISVALTITVSTLGARLLGFHPLFGLLSGGATAICGASAALALSAALPGHPQKDKATLFTVIVVSVLSTSAMIAYPMLVRVLQMGPQQAGMFLGGTIHDVAQVVGAGYSLSKDTGDAATLVKMIRVAMLLPVILVATLVTRSQHAPGTTRPPLLPGFAIVFAVLVALNSTGWLPAAVTSLGNGLSRIFLVVAIAAIGMKTQLKELAGVGFKPIALMLGETLFLAALVIGLLHVGR